MSNFSALEVSKRSLLAQQYALDTVSNNIANVNTPGFSRRTANFSETDPQQSTNGFIGTGVLVDKLRSYRNDFFDTEIQKSVSQQAGYESDGKVLSQIETTLAEPSDQGLNELTTNFFDSFEKLSQQPENLSLRQNLIDNTQSLIDRFHAVSASLQDTRRGVLSSINSNVSNINQLTSKIADLNKGILLTKTQGGSDIQTMVDQRAQSLDDLSKLAGVAVTNTDNGVLNVYINGQNVVSGSLSTKLALNETIAATGERTATLVKIDDKNNVIASVSVQSGEMASLLKHYNVTLDDKDSSSGFSIAKKLDDFVGTLAQKVNNISIGGYGLNDTGTQPAGRSFFTPLAGAITAANIEINSEIKDHPENIPLSDAPQESGNNNIARAIARISTDNTFLDGATPGDYYTGIIGRLGTISSDAQNGQTTTKLVSDQLINQRESVIGVNLDEEAVNLIKYQKAFEASSRVINTTNEILTTIINLGK